MVIRGLLVGYLLVFLVVCWYWFMCLVIIVCGMVLFCIWFMICLLWFLLCWVMIVCWLFGVCICLVDGLECVLFVVYVDFFFCGGWFVVLCVVVVWINVSKVGWLIVLFLWKLMVWWVLLFRLVLNNLCGLFSLVLWVKVIFMLVL